MVHQSVVPSSTVRDLSAPGLDKIGFAIHSDVYLNGFCNRYAFLYSYGSFVPSLKSPILVSFSEYAKRPTQCF